MTTSNNINPPNKHVKKPGTFYFKQFKVEDGRSTMKVGTDAVLLGAVADISVRINILEIGTGCGVIALILAQRSKAVIYALEADQESAKQAMENVRQSPWHDRIRVINKLLQEYAGQTFDRYDLIISNPPFFSRSLKSPEKKRNISRHDDLLSFDELISLASKLMLPRGSLWVILPVKESGEFIEIAGKSGIFVHFILKVIPKTGIKHNRVILQLKKAKPEKTEDKSLTILNADNSYTREYKEVMKELYLNL